MWSAPARVRKKSARRSRFYQPRLGDCLRCRSLQKRKSAWAVFQLEGQSAPLAQLLPADDKPLKKLEQPRKGIQISALSVL